MRTSSAAGAEGDRALRRELPLSHPSGALSKRRRRRASWSRRGASLARSIPDSLRALVDAAERHFLFVFQQKGSAPLARGMVLAPSITLDIGREEIADATSLFAQCWRTYGADPWLDTSEIETFDATEFPAYIAE